MLVHGSVVGGRGTWAAQAPLRRSFDVLVLERRGFAAGDAVERVDFDDEAWPVAEALGAGSHLAGHSYGGVIALLAAAARPESVRSLTVIEPPAAAVARGHPAVEAFVREGEAWWAEGPTHDPEAFLRGFLSYVGSQWEPPSPLPPEVEQAARTLVVERGPWEAEIPLAKLRAAAFPKLVVSGGHHPTFEAICDALAVGLDAERVVLRGAGHAVQRAPGFNEAFVRFLRRAEHAK